MTSGKLTLGPGPDRLPNGVTVPLFTGFFDVFTKLNHLVQNSNVFNFFTWIQYSQSLWC